MKHKLAVAWLITIGLLVAALAGGTLTNETGTDIEAASASCYSMFFVILIFVMVIATAYARAKPEGEEE